MSQAPLLAKAYLAPAFPSCVKRFPQIQLNGLVDDIGYDLEDDGPEGSPAGCGRDLKSRLDQLGLRVNAKKIAFVTGAQGHGA